jgi:hypothetical protein
LTPILWPEIGENISIFDDLDHSMDELTAATLHRLRHTFGFVPPSRPGPQTMRRPFRNECRQGAMHRMRFFDRRSLVLLAVLLACAADAAAQIVVVVNNNGNASDSNPGNGVCRTSNNVCTLRAAIQETNARSGLDTIQFAIGTGAQRISIGSGSVLPTITSPVIIDGWTQPGFSGTPLIELRGGSGDGIRITAGGSTVRGLVINGFQGRGIAMTGTNGNNVIEGNYIGLDAAGVDAISNRDAGVYIDQSSNNRIGGTTLQQRNIISGNMPQYTPGGNFGGIEIHRGGGNLIQGNFIGTDVTGMLDRGNTGRGISLVDTDNNVIGGPEAGAANLISGNFATGIRVRDGSSGNLIQGNFIGLNRELNGTLSNDRGVQIRNGSHNNRVIGNYIAGMVFNGILIWEGSSNNQVFSNWIFYNGFAERDNSCPTSCDDQEDYNGVLIWEGDNNYLLGNRIWANKHHGIAHGDPSDAPAADPPTVTSAIVSGNSTTVSGQVEGPAGVGFLIDFFLNTTCDSTYAGEGELYLGQVGVTTDSSGVGTFNVAMPWSFPIGTVVSSTATRAGRNTSGFSICTAVGQ